MLEAGIFYPADLRRLFYSTFLFSINLPGQKHSLQHIYAQDKKALNPKRGRRGGEKREINSLLLLSLPYVLFQLDTHKQHVIFKLSFRLFEVT